MSRSDSDSIADILEAVNRILDYTENVTTENFWKDSILGLTSMWFGQLLGMNCQNWPNKLN
jgi:uncharacterized protein with HEPN domain